MLERLWAGWRTEYVENADAQLEAGGCVFCRILESGLPDDDTYVLWRGDRSFAILNAFPYTSGHVMVMPLRHVSELDELDPDEADAAAVRLRDGENLGPVPVDDVIARIREETAAHKV